MSPPGESTAADREHELARLRVLAEAADAWARWRRQGSDESASSAERKLLSALDRLAPSGGGETGRNLVVLCSGCRRTRDRAEWVHLEEFLTETAGIDFTHSLCPECLGRLYPHRPAEPD